MEAKKICVILLKTVVATVLVTLIMLLLLSFALYKWNLREDYLGGGIIFTYVISNFVGGFNIGKVKEQRRFIWGALSGFIYFVILVVLSMIAGGTGLDMKSVIIAFLSCVLGGTVGGMVS